MIATFGYYLNNKKSERTKYSEYTFRSISKEKLSIY